MLAKIINTSDFYSGIPKVANFNYIPSHNFYYWRIKDTGIVFFNSPNLGMSLVMTIGSINYKPRLIESLLHCCAQTNEVIQRFLGHCALVKKFNYRMELVPINLNTQTIQLISMKKNIYDNIIIIYNQNYFCKEIIDYIVIFVYKMEISKETNAFVIQV